MSKWTHPICPACWKIHADTREPYRVIESPPEPCCFCGLSTDAGIFVRADPRPLRCQGIHEAESEKIGGTDPD